MIKNTSQNPLDGYMKIQEFVRKEARDIATDVYNTLGTRYNVAKVPEHQHDGVDTTQIPYTSISPNILFIPWTIIDTMASTASNYGVFWVSPIVCTVIGMTEVHATAGTNGGAVTLQLEKLTSGQALDAGVTLLQTALSLKTTANTPQNGIITLASTSNIRNSTLAVGDRLALKDSGTLTSVANLTVGITIQF